MFFKFYDFFPSQNLKLVYSFESLSLKSMQGNGVVYLAVLVPYGTCILRINNKWKVQIFRAHFCKLH